MKSAMTCLLFSAASFCVQPANADRISVGGPDEVVIPASSFGQCSVHHGNQNAPDVPDAPPRFVRRADGSIMMIAADTGNVPFFTKDGVSFSRHGCSSILTSKIDADPSKFADQQWVVGFYTKDGQNIFALVHNEYHGTENIPACKARLAPGKSTSDAICLQISQTGYISQDQGNSFRRIPFDQPLASAGRSLTPDRFSTFTRGGIHDPSNLVRNPADGYVYFVALADNDGPQQRGTCLFRSRDPLTQPWVAWDGRGFNARMGSPYGGNAGVCAPVRPWGIHTPAISYNLVLKKFIAVGQSDSHMLVALTSPDLIHWSAPINLKPSVQGGWWKPGTGAPDPAQYFSLFDPTSTSPSFETSGATPYVYFVHIPTTGGKLQWRSRDVSRFPLRVSP